MKIEVTKEDIKTGMRCNGQACPVANAIRRACPGVSFHVTRSLVQWRLVGIQAKLNIELPGKAISFIEAFDFLHEVQPITFELEIPA